MRRLVDKAEDAAHGRHGAVVDAAPASAGHAPPVHLRHEEGAVRVHRLDVADVTLRRRAADPHHHDGPGSGYGSLSEAECARVPPPLGGVATPRYIALVGNPPGAVAVGEAIGGPPDRAGGPGRG